MVQRRPVPLTAVEVDRLPGDCAGCLFWELAGPCPQPRSATGLTGLAPSVPPHEAARDPRDRKRDWVSARVAEGTPPGAIIEVAGPPTGATRAPSGTAPRREVMGMALFAPAEVYAPRSGAVPRISRDAVQLATVWVPDVHRQAGVGRLLLQAALREAIRLDRPAVEAYGDRRFRPRGCVLPDRWLLHEGFEVHREHPRTPVLRLETRRTVRWAASLEQAWEQAWEQAREEVRSRLPVPSPERGTVHGSGEPSAPS